MSHLQKLPLTVLKVAQACVDPYTTCIESLAALSSLQVLDLSGMSFIHGDQEVVCICGAIFTYSCTDQPKPPVNDM